EWDLDLECVSVEPVLECGFVTAEIQLSRRADTAVRCPGCQLQLKVPDRGVAGVDSSAHHHMFGIADSELINVYTHERRQCVIQRECDIALLRDIRSQLVAIDLHCGEPG